LMLLYKKEPLYSKVSASLILMAQHTFTDDIHAKQPPFPH